MKLLLRGFQTEAVESLLADYDAAQAAAARRTQALLLNAPTGSGKTVMMTALIEALLFGLEERPGDPALTFVWLTDQPELNRQTMEKMRLSSDVLGGALVTIDASLNDDALRPGTVYFLNTQKLGSGTSYVKRGDERAYTLWETIQRAVDRDPQRFVLVIDEAHRGTRGKDAAEADTIVAKFLRGSDGEIGAIPLVVGVSATPDRFTRLCGETGRTVWPVVIDTDDVRESGLIKDIVDLYHPDEKQPSHVTMLLKAVDDWKRYRDAWARYGDEQDEAVPRPILVVQVEDAKTGASRVSQTDLDLVVRTLADAIGPAAATGWIAHAFQDDVVVEAGGIAVRHLPPSEIEADPDVQVVLFKTSLNTGWDCPRAEVMVSFRPAKEETNIAQLVGRMVRSPLARRIEANEFLNSVSLYLPFYDRPSVERVVSRLTGDATRVPPTDVRFGRETETLGRAPGTERVFELLHSLPTYTVPRRRSVRPITRLAKIASLLAETGLHSAPVKEFRRQLLDVLLAERVRLSADPRFQASMDENSVLSIRRRRVHYTGVLASDAAEDAHAASDDPATVRIRVADQNINDLYTAAGRALGEGLHRSYARARFDDGVPVRTAKLELAALVAADGVVDQVESRANALRVEWVGRYKAAINALPERFGAVLRDVEGASTDPERTTLRLPTSIDGLKAGRPWPRHVYVGPDGLFHEDFVRSSWERTVLHAELARPDVVAWFRNPDRKPYSLCFSYRQGARWVPVYPDFVIVRQIEGGLIADIVDPHLLGDHHAPARAAGLAHYAADHSDKFGRIELIIISGEKVKRIDVVDPAWRERVARVSSHAHLADLFDQA